MLHTNKRRCSCCCVCLQVCRGATCHVRNINLLTGLPKSAFELDSSSSVLEL